MQAGKRERFLCGIHEGAADCDEPYSMSRYEPSGSRRGGLLLVTTCTGGCG